ncbi:MAG: hypothetical protein HY078_02515 [Elusimicrobia bacterium]|nr:hypothetical protein [Elusimicrobiota bacterium]
MAKFNASILFLGKEDDAHVAKALEHCRRNFSEVTGYLGVWGQPLSEEVLAWEGDYIISYLSRWVVPERLLKSARKAAINFHPASPDYPGIGCNNFALYEDAKEYGVTCHHMAARVDTGSIVAVERFPVAPEDTVASILARTYDVQLSLFLKIMDALRETGELPASSEKWTRRPFTRQEFNELRKIRPDMSREEIVKRIRATNFGAWKPYIELQGFVFELKTGKE